MYQTEDLIRTFKFDLNEITKYVISSLPIPDIEKKEVLLWYASIIENMRAQKIENVGHLKEVESLFIVLEQLHNKLITTDKKYEAIAKAAFPFIQMQKKQSENLIISPIQIATNAIYGFLLLKINGKDMNSEQQKMLTKFGDLLSYLSYKYKEHL